MPSKPILCVDFDGVIHSYTTPWGGVDVIADPPVPGALRWLWAALQHFNVVIYSSRSKYAAGVDAMRNYIHEHSQKEFDADHPMVTRYQGDGGGLVIAFASEKPAAFLTIDDRAICFNGDWSALDPAKLLEFKPWNKRPPVGDIVQPALNALSRASAVDLARKLIEKWNIEPEEFC